MTRRALLAVVAVLLSATNAAAQRTVVPFATGAIVEARVRLGGDVERVGGALWGAGATVSLNDWLSVRGRLASGSLSARTDGAESQSMAESEVAVIMVPERWIELDAGLMIRSMETPLARQRWMELRTGATLGLDIIEGMLRGTMQLSIAPSVSVSGQPAPDLALGAGTGLEYSSGRLLATLAYALDRYDFPAQGGSARLEQRSMLTARVGWRVR
jgi:hypothetical protein